MSIAVFLAILIILAAASFFVTAANKKAGGFATVAVSLFALAMVLSMKGSVGGEQSFMYLGFSITTVGWYFSVVMLTAYSMTSFFNPFWMKKMIYPAGYNFLYLVSMAGTIGMFFAGDFITLFIFWETVVWSSAFIIQQGKSRKASYVYYVLSAVGSMATLFAIMLAYSVSGTFVIRDAFTGLAGSPGTALVVFLAFILSGLSKMGIFPFHVWLPEAHGSAPHTFSPVLSGGLVKMGAFIAFLSVTAFPAYEIFGDMLKIMGIPAPIYFLMLLGALSIIIGTLMAIKQEDAKRLLAYSSVANGGYILIGILMLDQVGFAGGMMHLMNHALASAAAFLAIAAVAYRTGTTKMSEMGGMIHRMPVTYLVYLISIISMAGIPPMGGFVSKWLVFQGLADKGLLFIAAAAFFGSIGSFMYVFRPLSAVFLGQLFTRDKDVREVGFFMMFPMVVLTLLTLAAGVFPNIILRVVTEIQKSAGIEPVTLARNTIVTTNGFLDAFRVFIVFGFGFAIAFVLFIVRRKSRKVGLMDTYTSAEFIHTPELLHYSHSFYAPFERLYDKAPDTMNMYKKISAGIAELGGLVEAVFYGGKPAKTIFWIMAAGMVFFLAGGVFR
ncbi:MAG: NADH-quinone oxidoreductase subunit M [Clostridia bacterium]|nr:NADH-quinone oxidoreductase subunit M [Clostridia bacterium]